MDKKDNTNKTKKKIFFLTGGVIVGFLSGFFGGGGGMLVVPLLMKAGNLSEKEAHATAIAVILPLCLVSGAVYLFKGVYDFSVGLNIGLGFVVGGIIGSLLLKKLSCRALCIIFSILMVAGGIKLLW